MRAFLCSIRWALIGDATLGAITVGLAILLAPSLTLTVGVVLGAVGVVGILLALSLAVGYWLHNLVAAFINRWRG